jgi:hypothetical protein
MNEFWIGFMTGAIISVAIIYIAINLNRRGCHE